MNISLSVIIPTRNRATLLDNTLKSIVAQTMDKSMFEVIVVDNASTDNTKAIADKYKNELNIKYIYEAKPGLHEGRHAGLRASNTDILVYADDDIEAFPKWLETILTVFSRDEKIVLVGGKNIPKYQSPPPDWIQDMWSKKKKEGYILGDLSILDLGEVEKNISPYLVFGCNFSVRKNIVLEAGGFHPDGMPFELIKYRGDGETYISKYIEEKKYLTYYHPLASVYHIVTSERMTKEYFYKRRYTQGISDAYTFLRSKNKSTKNKKRTFKRIIKSLLFAKKSQLQLDKLTDFKKEMNLNYNKGYQYLLSCYENEPEVVIWIHKETYL